MQKYKPRSFSKRTARPTLTRPESLVEFEIYQPFLDRSSQDWIWNVFFYSNKLNQLRICLLKKSAAFLEMAAIVLQVIFKAKLGTFFMSSYWVKKQMLPRFSQVYKYFFHEPISLPEQLQILNWKPNFLNEQLFFLLSSFCLLSAQARKSVHEEKILTSKSLNKIYLIWLLTLFFPITVLHVPQRWGWNAC